MHNKSIIRQVNENETAKLLLLLLESNQNELDQNEFGHQNIITLDLGNYNDDF